MAKFRDSSSPDTGASIPPALGDASGTDVHDRSIGDIIRQTNNLTAEEVEGILKFQRDNGVRFGEAAVALGHASDQDVLFALSQQFHYPYAPEERRTFSEELVVANKPFSRQAEAFRAIRSQITMRLFSGDTPKGALAVVSPESGDGRTYFAANIAVALSQLGGRTLLVDADLRDPRQHKLFGVGQTSGLSSILAGRAEGSVIQQVADLPSLFLLPVGTVPPNPLELLERPAFGLLIRELVSKFDYVVVDTSAATRGADCQVAAARCGAALAVARKGTSRMEALQDLTDNLSESPAKLVGLVMNEF